MNNTGELIKRNRLKLGLNQKDLSKKLGFSNQFLGEIENHGTDFPHKKLKRVSKLLKINKHDLINSLMSDYWEWLRKWI